MSQILSTRTLIGMVCAALALGGVAVAATDSGRTTAPRDTAAECPERALPLPPDAVAPASSAALDSQRGRYAELATRPIVTTPPIQPEAPPHRGYGGPDSKPVPLEGPLDSEPQIPTPMEGPRDTEPQIPAPPEGAPAP